MSLELNKNIVLKQKILRLFKKYNLSIDSEIQHKLKPDIKTRYITLEKIYEDLKTKIVSEKNKLIVSDKNNNVSANKNNLSVSDKKDNNILSVLEKKDNNNVSYNGITNNKYKKITNNCKILVSDNEKITNNCKILVLDNEI